MKTKIWKRVCNRVRIIEDEKGYFLVQARDKFPFKKGYTEWHTLNQFSMHKHALNKKHSYIVMILMRELGLRPFFIERRIKRKEIRQERYRAEAQAIKDMIIAQ